MAPGLSWGRGEAVPAQVLALLQSALAARASQLHPLSTNCTCPTPGGYKRHLPAQLRFLLLR